MAKARDAFLHFSSFTNEISMFYNMIAWEGKLEVFEDILAGQDQQFPHISIIS